MAFFIKKKNLIGAALLMYKKGIKQLVFQKYVYKIDWIYLNERVSNTNVRSIFKQ